MKKCIKCEQLLPIATFHNSNRAKDGKLSICKACKATIDKAYRDEHREELNQKTKIRHTLNKERYSANRTKRYHNASEEEILLRKTRSKQYNKNAPDHVKERKKLYDKEYYKSEKGKSVIANSTHKRRAQKIASADGTVTSQALEELKIRQEYKCWYCKTDLCFTSNDKAVHLDHIIPLSKGGAHSITNVVWACAKCNLTKGDKIIDV